MGDPVTSCPHAVTTARHDPVLRKRFGWMRLDRITCPECAAEVRLRTYDDPRDDPVARSIDAKEKK